MRPTPPVPCCGQRREQVPLGQAVRVQVLAQGAGAGRRRSHEGGCTPHHMSRASFIKNLWERFGSGMAMLAPARSQQMWPLLRFSNAEFPPTVTPCRSCAAARMFRCEGAPSVTTLAWPAQRRWAAPSTRCTRRPRASACCWRAAPSPTTAVWRAARCASHRWRSCACKAAPSRATG